MFIGHFGIGFVAKKYTPAVSLGFLFIAAQFLDLLWPTLLLLDIEHVSIWPGLTVVTPLEFYDYPISHSLLAVMGWGILLGGIAWFLLKDTSVSIIIFLCVMSHWILDLIVHIPDLPIMPGSETRVGFGLWNYPIATLIAELFFFLGGVYFYYKTTSAKNKIGKFGLIFLVLFLLVIQIGNMFGPPPPSVNAIAWVGQLQWIIVILAFVVDKNRTT